MRLLIDIGNSMLHLALYQNENQIFNVNLRSTDAIKKIKYLIRLNLKPFQNQIASFVFSSVKPELEVLINFFKKEYSLNYLIINNSLRTNLEIELDDPQTLGSDLLAAAVGVVALNRNQDAIIINLGTATTIFCIKNETFIGGTIMPGLITSAASLIARASLLTQPKWSLPPTLIAKNTADCLNTGVIYGHALAIKGFVTNYKKKLVTPEVIILGGNYTLVKDILKNYHHQPDLIFKGLNKLWDLNKGVQ